jgi:hypothetical protein
MASVAVYDEYTVFRRVLRGGIRDKDLLELFNGCLVRYPPILRRGELPALKRT